MHYITLITMEIPKIGGNGKACDIASLLEACIHPENSTFSRAVLQGADYVLEQYAAKPSDPEFLVFEDETLEVEDSYKNGTIDCIKTPDGRILRIIDPLLQGKYEIYDGIVYKSNWGFLHHRKLTKTAKKMKALPDYPFSKLYNNLEQYVKETEEYVYHEEQNAYGYYYNPDAFYDWYSVGGRWYQLFLVKEDCIEFSFGEPDMFIEKLEAPKGYRWVCAARKKDIEWQAMLNLKVQGANESFKKYPVSCYGFLQNGVWICQDDQLEPEMDWETTVAEFISGIDDEIVIVGIDCHM